MICTQGGRGHSLRLLLVLAPLLVAVMVAISRVRDYWHHWEGNNVSHNNIIIIIIHILLDVTVGGLIGKLIKEVSALWFSFNNAIIIRAVQISAH